jgi:hypothetical protein
LDQDDHFQNIATTCKTLFWHIFGYGEADDADLYVRSVNIGEEDRHKICDPTLDLTERKISINKLNQTLNGTFFLQDKNHQPTEMMGYMILGGYHIVTVVILLNILIAMLNSIYVEIQKWIAASG